MNNIFIQIFKNNKIKNYKYEFFTNFYRQFTLYYYFIIIGEKAFPFTLKDTAATNELKENLPFEIQMTKMNNNEIYYKFNEKFITEIKSV